MEHDGRKTHFSLDTSLLFLCNENPLALEFLAAALDRKRAASIF